MNRLRIDLVALVLLCTLSAVSDRSSLRADGVEPFWLNLPSCPLEILVDGTRSHLRNMSRASITSYQMGCIVKRDGKVNVVSQEKEEFSSLQPVDSGKGSILLFPKPSHVNYLSGRCAGSTKLSVVQVRFADGAVWTVKTLKN